MTNKERSELANSVTEKMTYMCGCRNCITTVEQIILNDRKPFDSQCDDCDLCDLPNRVIRKKGHWIHESEGIMDCSVCGISQPTKDVWNRTQRFYFCPSCGAIME